MSAATHTLSVTMAPALRNLRVSLSGDGKPFQIDKTTALVNYDNDSAASYESLGNDLALADANWSNAVASASAAWSLADANATITPTYVVAPPRLWGVWTVRQSP